MSEMEAVKVRLGKLNSAYANKHLTELLHITRKGDSEYEVYEYCTQHKIKFLNGVVYSAKIEELDTCGFISKVKNDYENFIEITALYHNGGACLDEILESALQDKASEFGDE